ncbi:hypothetical protein BGX27_000758, partial [Mortierella sp. AM989]
HDLAQCVLVSKDWHFRLTPALWSDPEFGENNNPKWIAALYRHQDFVRSVLDSCISRAILMDLKMPSKRSWRLPNLQSIDLDFEEHDTVDTVMSAVLLIDKIPTLESLSMGFGFYGNDVHELLISTLEMHPGLRKVHVSGADDFHPLFIQEIIKACSRMCSLNLDFSREMTYTEKILDERVHQASAAAQLLLQMHDTHIRELSIHFSCTYIELSVVAPLLMRCPLLEKLKLAKICELYTLRLITKKLRTGSCPRLKDVEFGNFSAIDPSEEDIGEALLSMRHISDNDSNGDSDCGLETISFSPSLGFGLSTLLALTRYHSKTLAHLRCDSSEALGELKNLTTLVMANASDFLMLKGKYGYLSGLAKLKKIKRLEILAWAPLLMSATEAKWMVENWPKLNSVVFGRFTCHLENDMLRFCQRKKFLKSLVAKRPWMEIENREIIMCYEDY